jgi:CHAD domain-containing protein
MAFRLKLNEPMDRGFKRIAKTQLERALAQLTETPSGPVVAIHEARKSLKRTRALLKLCRPCLDDDAFKALNLQIGDIGRALSASRDLDVIEQVITKAAGDDGLKPTVIVRLRKALDAARIERAAPSATSATLQGTSNEALAAVIDAIAAIDLRPRDEHHISLGGLKRSMNLFREAHTAADRPEPAVDALHDWRKAVQLHWRHMQLLSPAWPAFCEARIAEARAISALIGEERDLGLLSEFAGTLGEGKLTPAMVRAVNAYVVKCQPPLLAQAKLRSARLLVDGTSGFCRRMQGYWHEAAQLKRL